MTSNDKTRQKLVDSMRKTKVAANNKTTATDTKVKSATSAEQPKTKKAEKANKKTMPKVSVDPYQSRGRVWPD